MISEIEVVQNLAYNVRELMQAKGWSQSKLARQAGLTPMQVSYIIRGKQHCGVFYAARLMEAFEVSFDRLIREPRRGSHALRAG